MIPLRTGRRKSWDSAGLPPQFLEVRGEETLLGRGSCGEVRRAWDSARDTYVAIKRSRTGPAIPKVEESYLADCIEHEANMLAGLDHPHLPKALAYCRQGPCPQGPAPAYLVTELVQGGDLETEGLGSAPRHVILGALAALAQVHRQGIVHGDIHLGNILREGQRSLLIDFELAQAIDPGADPEDAQEAICEDFTAMTTLLARMASAAAIPQEEVRVLLSAPMMLAWRAGQAPAEAALRAHPFFMAAEPPASGPPCAPQDVSRETSASHGVSTRENGDAGSPAAL